VDSGFLDFDVGSSTYRLGAPFLSFGEMVKRASHVLETALPLMREVAEGLRINVGLAVADSGDMVYLESVRRSQLGLFRRVVSGSRVPIGVTALGRAWLAGVGESERRPVLKRIAARSGARWPTVCSEIDQAIAQVERAGYCSAVWKTGLVSIAAPLVAPGTPVHALNISFPEDDSRPRLEARYVALLMEMSTKVTAALRARPRLQHRA
jgi:DNA-binding IclR family transcriptional regulator